MIIFLKHLISFVGDQDTGEFYLLPSIVRTPSKRFRKAEIFLSIHEMEANENLMASIYEVRTGVKVSSRHLPSHRSGWLPLPITKMLKQWIPREQVPLRFKIFIKGRGGNESTITDHIQTPKVWLVLYTKVDHEHPFPHLAPDVEMRGPSGDRRRRDITRTKMPESKKACRKEDMIVNSMALSSSVKIIHPKSFNAFQCSGKCSETEKTKFINHSLLKDFVLQKKGIKRNEEPCCFPTKLKPITFIYKTDNGGFVIRAVKDLIVEECGCH